MFHKILVAMDQSEICEQVFEEAVALAKATNACLLLLHALSPLEDGYPTPVYPGPDSLYPTLHDEALKNYTRQWESFERKGLELVRSHAERAIAAGLMTEFTQNTGDPGRTICQIARTWDADLIVLGRRGRSGLSEMLLGSVSNYVLHHAPCSVLTVQGLHNRDLPSPAIESEATLH